jgi:glycosyltransferase involved in cell wall biosynthesis
MNTALLISTYNWPEALELVLESVVLQSVIPDEVLIADDGSDDITKQLLHKFQGRLNIKHIWHDDLGFRKSAILNKALAQANSEYIIQIDGDCILHQDFIKDHLNQAMNKTFIYGSRVNIKPNSVSEVFGFKTLKFPFYSSIIKNKTRNLRIPVFSKMYGRENEFSKKTRGCNISYFRKDILAINGYDETMEGWGREDSEMVLRLLNNGVLGRRLRFAGIVYHIYHPIKSKDRLIENQKIQERTIQEKKKWCSNGIDKYLSQ